MPEITLPQGTIHYRDEGVGPPLVFVHGALVTGGCGSRSSSGWRATCAASSRTCRSARTRTPMRPDADLIPHGLAQLIADLLDALDVEDVTLVGNDTGGALCQLVGGPPSRAARPARAHELRRVRELPAEGVPADRVGRPRTRC